MLPLWLVAIRNAEELIAWQLADAFKVEVYRLLRESSSALQDFQYWDQRRASSASVSMNLARRGRVAALRLKQSLKA